MRVFLAICRHVQSDDLTEGEDAPASLREKQNQRRNEGIGNQSR